MQLSLFEIQGSIDVKEFQKMFTPNVRRIVTVIQKYGFELRIVGGAVRDFLRGKVPRDIDFATNADPAELMFIFDREGIEHDDSGVSHGTIKAVFSDGKIDVTSISYQIMIVKGKPKIDRKKSWELDAKRRDLTINAMSVDLNGHLYDYLNGLNDLENQIVRLTKKSQKHLDQNPYVILRWFNALSMFSQPRFVKKDLKLISDNIGCLRRIRKATKTQKLLRNMMRHESWPKILQLMCQTGAAPALGITCDSR